MKVITSWLPGDLTIGVSLTGLDAVARRAGVTTATVERWCRGEQAPRAGSPRWLLVCALSELGRGHVLRQADRAEAARRRGLAEEMCGRSGHGPSYRDDDRYRCCLCGAELGPL